MLLSPAAPLDQTARITKLRRVSPGALVRGMQQATGARSASGGGGKYFSVERKKFVEYLRNQMNPVWYFQVVGSRVEEVEVNVPYVPGYLAFRGNLWPWSPSI